MTNLFMRATTNRRRHAISRLLFLALLLLFSASLYADTLQPTYPASYAAIVSGAKREGELILYSTVHSPAAREAIFSAFKKLYPFINLHDTDIDSSVTYQQFLQENKKSGSSADFIWSSAMDLQEKLINDGYAQPYASPEIRSIPDWAHWQELGYGTTLEPVVTVYNTRFVSAREMPQSHSALRDMLLDNPDKFRGRVAIYDPEKTEVGMLYLSQDVRATRDSWELFDAFGKAHAKTFKTSAEMLRAVISGNQWIAYDVIASNAFEAQEAHPELSVLYPSDFVLIMSRVGFITAGSRHPDAAKLFLDFLLSPQGQQLLKSHGMGAVRTDMEGPSGKRPLDPDRSQAIRIGPGLLSGLDSLVRAQFLRRWHQSQNPCDKDGDAGSRLTGITPTQSVCGSRAPILDPA